MLPIDNEDLRETTLSPEVRRIRNSIIKKFAHEPLDIMGKFVKDVVENEQDTIKRLGAMAARVEILRMRISQISDASVISTFDELTEEEVEEHKLEEESNEIVITSPNLSDWVRLRIIENSEINGVRFPKGVVIDVSQEDGDRLLESGKASYVDVDEIADVKSDVNLQQKNELKSAAKGDEDLVTDSTALDEKLSAENQSSKTDDTPKKGKNTKKKTSEKIMDTNEEVSAGEEQSEIGQTLRSTKSQAEKGSSEFVNTDEQKSSEKESLGVTKSSDPLDLSEVSDLSQPDEGVTLKDESEMKSEQPEQSPDDLLAGFDLDSEEPDKK